MAAATRTYQSTRRQEQARQTRRAVLAAAGDLFGTHGYSGTTMKAVAARAAVSVPSVELLFGTKAALLKAAVDSAIAGDDEPVAMLDRDWTAQAQAATSAAELLTVAAAVITPAQQRSAALVLAVLESARFAPELAELAQERIHQRRIVAGWLVDAVTALTPLRPELHRGDAVDSVWLLMDPAIYQRLTDQCGWPAGRYRRWFATSAHHLLIPDVSPRRRRTG